ncbi:MAG: XTP/dITP diphosphatase [Thermodesulfobacteriota bacterium]
MTKKRLPARILIATRNKGKVREIRDLVADLPVAFLSLDDLPDAPDVVEDAETFEGNALKKATILAQATGIPALADDSGLCVDALGGRPGVHSARYAGEGASDADRIAKLLNEMRDVPEQQRSARFVCALALAWPGGESKMFMGTCEGRITHEPRGLGGFGFDPVFYFPEAGCTFAEMDRQAKNQVSHRGKALWQLAEYLTTLTLGDE